MESQQDIVDLTINDDDDCFFLTEPSETAANSLKMNGMEGNKETAKQNHEDVSVCGSEDGESVYGSEDGEINAKQNQEDDTFSVYGSEDGEITAKQNQEDDTFSVYGSEDGEIAAKQNQEDDTLSVYGSEDGEIAAKQNQEDDTLSVYGSKDGEIATEEKEEESKKIIFKRIWSNFRKKPRKATPQSAAFDVYSCSHKTIYPGQMERFSLGFKMKMPKGYCAKIYGRLGMTVKHGIHLAGGISIIDGDFRGPISICLKNSHRSCPYEFQVNDRVAQMMIERVDDFEWIEGTEDDFKIEGVSENASEGQCGRKRIRNLEGFGSTGI